MERCSRSENDANERWNPMSSSGFGPYALTSALWGLFGLHLPLSRKSAWFVVPPLGGKLKLVRFRLKAGLQTDLFLPVRGKARFAVGAATFRLWEVSPEGGREFAYQSRGDRVRRFAPCRVFGGLDQRCGVGARRGRTSDCGKMRACFRFALLIAGPACPCLASSPALRLS